MPSRRSRLACLAAAVAVALSAVTSLAVFLVASPATPAAAAQGFAWEYRVISGRRIIQTRDTQALKDGSLSEFTQWNGILNGLGAEGWELVAVLGGPGDSVKDLFLKRPR